MAGSPITVSLDAASVQRERAADLVSGLEALIGKLSAMPVMPLDILDRYERAIVKAHTSNLLRLPAYTDADLMVELEPHGH